ncbi:hypothetical protein pdam_00021080 [Pocillopora damicornis]|uniref:EGF-like domain-containing protein n=1 Tax=Pocillopora damicornis TaxID=46731 RepID=A0A3M6TR44_POCDA|nr:hypothetical protein pdam_00021080 [Pocillopora damicornis]
MLHARTPKDRTFVLVTPDRLKMEATAQKEKHYHLCKSCFTSIPCIKRDECRLEDNGDNDTIVFNKHSVRFKHLSYSKNHIDECARNLSCHVNANCTNTIGSHVCTCHTGYTGDGQTCSDIDECQKNTHNCHLNATCQNTNGSFVCTCLFGFNGDGRNCTDIDECARNLSCHVNANCTNKIGSHACTCHTGYTGDGQTCSDIDECSQMKICDKNASCSNTQGSYSCACNPKYIGDGLTCKDIDECKGSHSCHVNAICTNTLGSHVCQCHAGYTGNGQNCTGEFNLFATICRTVLHDTFDYSAAPFSRVAK